MKHKLDKYEKFLIKELSKKDIVHVVKYAMLLSRQNDILTHKLFTIAANVAKITQVKMIGVFPKNGITTKVPR